MPSQSALSQKSALSPKSAAPTKPQAQSKLLPSKQLAAPFDAPNQAPPVEAVDAKH